MIEKIINWSVENRYIVMLAAVAMLLWGVWALNNTAVDAIPDLSDNQVIVFTEWPGRSPQIIEDQITYPLTSNLLGLPHVKAVRGTSMFGFSWIYIIFEDDVDLYWARTRVLERLNYLAGTLPSGVSPVLGPDGTGVGHVFWYTVEGKKQDLAELRALQDWYIRYQLNAVPGVAEVASMGGFVRQYEVELDPRKLFAYGLSVGDVMEKVKASNNEVGGSLLNENDVEFQIRGRGYVQSVADLENIVLKTGPGGVPVYLKNVAAIQLGGAERRGVIEKNGNGEVVGGIIVMRFGENAKAVIDRVKEKIKELKRGLPPGVEIKTAYDRSILISEAVRSLRQSLVEEMVIVCLVIMLFLFHMRSSLIVILTIPLAVLGSFIAMRYFGITSNLMSLGGIAVAIGVLDDSGIVMVENAHRHLTDNPGVSRIKVILKAAKQVGRPIFFSMAIIVLSFVPVFMLEGPDKKLFFPLAFTKTAAMAVVAVLAITLVPVLTIFFLTGNIKPEEKNVITRTLARLYVPVLDLCLRNPWKVLGINLLALVFTLVLFFRLGREWMPPLYEGSLLYMPVTLPNITVTEAKRVLQAQDEILTQFPEVDTVLGILGKVGRAETATDPAPVSMIETIVNLKPKDEWRPGMDKDKLIAEMNEKTKIPGVVNAWTMPIINRINMLATGVRTELGLKIMGDNLDTLERLAIKAEEILHTVPGATDLFAERTVGGSYLEIVPNREKLARYGLSVKEVQDVIEVALGGMIASRTVEGRRRFPIRVRYARAFRDNLEAIKRTLVMTSSGAQIPLEQLADIRLASGPPMINSEASLLRSLVLLNVRGRDVGGFVEEADAKLKQNLRLPPSYYYTWSGQYENQLRTKKRLQLVMPLVIAVIFVLLYFTFHSFLEALMVMLSVPFAMVGGMFIIWLLGYNLSVAVWVGLIALFGVAVETGVVMVIYLHEALDKKLAAGSVTAQGILEATREGAILRLRPKLMTVCSTFLGLVPIMWSGDIGSDVMKPIAAPMIGGMITSTIHVLLVTPIIFRLMKERALKTGTLRTSDVKYSEGL
ncbi:MAG TPA: CusA/CzcA family heavy metal efflux RND transporter [Verrucomicrobiae bacterium]|nr:CusA/CzcA family heavy metal efflux RND transporter [Verrucomicrobiae bacterium]